MSEPDYPRFLQELLSSCPEAGDGVHPWLFKVARYYAKQKERIIYEPCEREFYEYDPSSGIFVPQSSDRIRTGLSALVLDAAQTWDGWYGMNVFRNAENLAGAITHLRGQVEERDFFNQPSHFVHLGNCTLKFEPDGSKFSVEPFSPEHPTNNSRGLHFQGSGKRPGTFGTCIFSILACFAYRRTFGTHILHPLRVARARYV